MKRFFLLLFLFVFLPGCTKKAESVPTQSLAVEVVLCTNRDGTFSLSHFSEASQIQGVLDSLRHLPLSYVSTPQAEGTTFTLIQVRCMGGKCHTYEWLDNTYLRKDRGQWRMLPK